MQPIHASKHPQPATTLSKSQPSHVNKTPRTNNLFFSKPKNLVTLPEFKIFLSKLIHEIVRMHDDPRTPLEKKIRPLKLREDFKDSEGLFRGLIYGPDPLSADRCIAMYAPSIPITVLSTKVNILLYMYNTAYSCYQILKEQNDPHAQFDLNAHFHEKNVYLKENGPKVDIFKALKTHRTEAKNGILSYFVPQPKIMDFLASYDIKAAR